MHPSHKIVIGQVALLAFLSLSSLEAQELRVVTTTTDLKSIAEAVGGAFISVTSIGNGKQDPHFIDARPSYMIQLRRADLFIRIGLEIERGWENLVLEGSRNRKIQLGNPGHLDASAGIEPLEVPTGIVDRSMGDVHPLGNPHYWLDPFNGRLMAHTIADRLGQLDPDHAQEYLTNAARFARRIDEAMFGSGAVEEMWAEQSNGNRAPAKEGWSAMLAPYAGTQVVTYHRSWSYFLRRFGLISVGELEAKPGIAPSPGHLKSLIDMMKTKQVPLLIMVSFKGDKAPKMVAGRTGARIVKVPYSTNGNDVAVDYIAMLDQIVRQVAAALEP